MKNDGEKNWRPSHVKYKDPDQVAISISALNADGKTLVLYGSRGSLLITTDGGKSWFQQDLWQKTPRWVQMALSANGNKGVVATSEGAFITLDAGKRWHPASLGELYENRITSLGVFVPTKDTNINQTHSSNIAEQLQNYEVYVAETSDGKIYYLPGEYREFQKWDELTLAKIRNEMAKDETLSNSQVFRDISQFISDIARLYEDNADANNNGLNDGILDNLTMIRAVTLAVLFFLVQLLVRLYQYSLRLASFWESRADAILLAESFADKKTERFDNLVSVLAPDAYDFKSPPKSPLDWLSRR